MWHSLLAHLRRHEFVAVEPLTENVVVVDFRFIPAIVTFITQSFNDGRAHRVGCILVNRFCPLALRTQKSDLSPALTRSGWRTASRTCPLDPVQENVDWCTSHDHSSNTTHGRKYARLPRASYLGARSSFRRSPTTYFALLFYTLIPMALGRNLVHCR